jgi:hypothetical protein
MAFYAFQSTPFDCRFGSVLRFYADMAEFDKDQPTLGVIKAAIETQNEGLYFGEHYGVWTDKYHQGEYADFTWSEITKTIADIK